MWDLRVRDVGVGGLSRGPGSRIVAVEARIKEFEFRF